MKAEINDNGAKERSDFEGRSTGNLILEILQLIQQQTEMLHTGAICPEWAATYKSRAWKIRELLRLLRSPD
jgi:hypothetical protein